MYQAALVDWMKKNPKASHQLTWQHLHAETEPYQVFLSTFDNVGTKFKMAKEALKMDVSCEQEHHRETGES